MLEVKRQDGVLLAVLSSIHNRNAFSEELISALSSLDCSSADIVVFTNEGRVFSAGLDLKAFLTNKEYMKKYLYLINNLVIKILDCNANTIVYLNGDAYGFGVEFTYFADVVAAARPDIVLSLQGVRYGVLPPYTLPLADVLGFATVRALLAGPLTAEAASRLGLVHYIAPLEEVLRTVLKPPPHIFARVKAHRRLLRKALESIGPSLEDLAQLAEDADTRSLVAGFLGRGGRGK